MKNLHIVFILGGLCLFLTSACTETKKTDKYGITMIKIPAGDFMMGDNAISDERPAHKVTLDSFWMAQTEVTQKQFHEVMGSNPSKFTSKKLGYPDCVVCSDNYPVEKVSWTEAKWFCERLGYRLPTEAEWEYAARAGTTGDHYGALDEIAWYYKNSNDQTHPVAKKSPNSFGLYDMSGNVFEWVNDVPSSGSTRVLRGGSFYSDANALRASYRGRGNPGNRDSGLGFRCAQ